MQRKNGILMKHNHKNGIAMIMAIAVIVIIATIMALSLALTSQTTKRTNDLYLYEQSVLLSRSAAEYALLRIAQDGPCTHVNDLNFIQDTIYDINISIQYIYENITNPCTAAQTYATVVTPEQNGSVLMDISVSVPQSANVVTEPIRYFRRTIQKL
jgi:type II secretory pathway pseudopilin PulG